MATATARLRLHPGYDNLFFSGMAGVALIAVLVGFARTYFLAGLFRAPLPSLLVHIHGAAFTLWIILFISQISLVTAGRVDLHRRLGLLGFVLAIVMIVLGTLAANGRLARRSVTIGGEAYTLTARQAQIIEILHKAHIGENSDVSTAHILEALETKGSRWQDTFRTNPSAKNALIKSGARRGTLRLNV